MAAPFLHGDARPLNNLCGANMLSAGNISTNAGYALITNAIVAAANTTQGLIDAIDAAFCHADVVPAKKRFDLAVTLGKYAGSFTDANIAPLTTVTGLVELTYASVTNGIQQQVPE